VGRRCNSAGRSLARLPGSHGKAQCNRPAAGGATASPPGVERVWYPKWEFNHAYESVRRPHGGWGALITFLPKDAERRSAGIYDRLELCKGPSLGTVFTLVCPFTLLAHYTELAWAESCGVSRYLLRVSAGLEDPEGIWEKLDQALR